MSFPGHHPWCNFSAAGPVHECRQCKRMFEQYPPAKDMLAQYFPDAKPIGSGLTSSASSGR